MSRLTPTFLYLGGGLIVWFVRFIGAYAFTGLACARSWQGTTILGLGLIPAGLVLSATIGVAICLALILHAISRLRRTGEENSRFVHVLAALVAGIGALAMVLETAPVLFLAACPA